MLFLGLTAFTYQVQAEDFYAPWTKSKITNNTQHPIIIDARYTIPGCKQDDLRPIACQKEGTVKVTLKPGKTITVVSESGYPSDSIEGQVGPGDNIGGNGLLINLDPKTKKQTASNVAPYTLENPPLKSYKVRFDGKNLTVEQSPL